jgi:enoyl-CoA hydratase/carnithine racemase
MTVHVARDLDGRRLTVTIDRPDVLNALDRATLRALRAAFLEAADAEGRVVESFEIVTLSGRRSLRGT